MKKFFVMVVITIIIILIYNLLKDNKIYYVSISDNTIMDQNISYAYKDYIKDYLEEKNKLEKYTDISNDNFRITDIIRNINDNISYDDKSIQNILIKADLLTISVGYNDLINKINIYNSYEIYKYIDSYLKDITSLFDIIRKYDKEKIIMLGYYNPYDKKYDDLIDYINKRLNELSNKYNIDFLEISNIKNYLDDNILSIEGQHKIFDEIRIIIDKK